MLGNKYPLVQVYIQDVSTGKEQNIGLQSDEWTVATDSGIHYNPIDSNTGTIRIFEKILGESAATPGELDYLNIVGNTAYRIKIVASAGGGGAGPRAHVSFDGKDPSVNSTKANVFNVSLITDNGTGNYTVTFANPISNPVVSATIASDQTYAQNPYPKESKIAVFEISSTSVQVRTGRGSYSAIDCPVHLVVF